MKGTDETPRPQNSLQEWTWRCWEDFWTRFHKRRKGEPYILVAMGDLIEGHHHRTIQVMDFDSAPQNEAARVAFEPHVEQAEKFYVVIGTECHVHSAEGTLGRILGAEKHPDTGASAAHQWLIDIGGTLCAFQHHMPTTSRKYLEAGSLSIMLGNLQLNDARAGYQVPRVAFFGHRHVPGFYTDGDGACIVTPSWQGLTSHGHKVASTSRTVIGGTVCDFPGKGGLPTWEYGWMYRPKQPGRVKA